MKSFGLGNKRFVFYIATATGLVLAVRQILVLVMIIGSKNPLYLVTLLPITPLLSLDTIIHLRFGYDQSSAFSIPNLVSGIFEIIIITGFFTLLDKFYKTWKGMFYALVFVYFIVAVISTFLLVTLMTSLNSF
jgi:hypothetical protein